MVRRSHPFVTLILHMVLRQQLLAQGPAGEDDGLLLFFHCQICQCLADSPKDPQVDQLPRSPVPYSR